MKENQHIECKQHDIATPIYEYGMSGLMLTFHANPQHLVAALGGDQTKRSLRDKVGDRVGEKVGEREKMGLGKEDSGTAQETTQKTTQRILAALRSNPAGSRREIAELLGDITEDGVKYHLGKLRSQGRIRRIGPDKGGHWEIVRDDDA